MAEHELLLTILASVTMFVYCIMVTKFASNILHGATKRLGVHILIALVNSAMVMLMLFTRTPVQAFYFSILLVLTVEFIIISKAKFWQVFFGSVIFAMHITSMHLLFVFLYTNFIGISSGAVLGDMVHSLEIAFYCSVTLAVVLVIVWKFIPIKAIIRVSEHKTYSKVVAMTAFGGFLIFCAESFFLISDNSFPEQFYFVVATFVFSVLTFYLTFIFTLNFSYMTLDKRKSDYVQNKYAQILEKKHEAITKLQQDSLTGVYNKSYLFEVMNEINGEIPFGVVYVDINGLKYVNDTFGHEVGDELIISITNSIMKTLREGDIVARVGGDELVIILPDASEESVLNITDRMENEITLLAKQKNFPLSASMGSTYVSLAQPLRSRAEILHEADERMRANKVSFYEKGGVK